MADLERLVVSLDADITRLTRQLSKAGISLNDFAKDADAKAGAAKTAINKHLSPGSGGLSTIQFQELSSAARHSFDAIIAGASPLRVLAVEGTKASAAIGSGGLAGFAKQLGTSLGAVLTPARLAAGGVAGIGIAALVSLEEYQQAQISIRTGLSGIGAASHATVNDIEGISESVAAASRISVSSARTIATALAATGKIDVSKIGGIANLSKGFGVLTGKNTEDAGKELAAIFADPAKGVDILNERLGALDGQTVELVKHLANSGDVLGAQDVLINAVAPDYKRAAEQVSFLSRAYDDLKSAVSGASTVVGKAIASAVDPDLQQQLARLEAEKAARKSGTGGAYQQSFLDEDGGEDAARDKQIAYLKDKIAGQQKQDARNANLTKADAQNTAVAPIIEANDPLYFQIQRLKEQIGQMQLALRNAQNFGTQPAGGYDHLADEIGGADAKLKELQDDYAKGGTAGAAALRAANFQAATAGLSAYSKALAQINLSSTSKSARRKPQPTQPMPSLRPERMRRPSGRP